MRFHVLLGAMGLGLVSTATGGSDAKACGGCFHAPTQNGDVITDHRMIFSVSPEQTTLYDEIEYQGDPQSFAWVLPIHGQVAVGLSADVLFAALDSATTIIIEPPPLPVCPSCNSCGGPSEEGAGSSGGAFAGVNIISQAVVGPYDTVQLQSTDANALSDWLTANGFAIPADIQPIIAAYVQEGFDFLALKLQPGQGVQAMRPVRVTTSGASLSLPLRMVAAGTGATVGVTLWVVGQGRYEAMNFPNFTIVPSDLTWDWNLQLSNYTSVQQQKESATGFATWQTESSLDLSPFQIESGVLSDEASVDYQPIAASGSDASVGETADQVRDDDLAAIFPNNSQGTVRITRMRADLAHAALAKDLALQASADQSNVSNVYQLTKSVNAPACATIPNPCPVCNGSSGGGSSGGNVGGAGTVASSGQSSAGCSAVPSERGGQWLDLALASLLGVSIVRTRLRRKDGSKS